MELAEITIKDRPYTINVDKSGVFSTVMNGEVVRNFSLNALIEEVSRKTRRRSIRIDVPFARINTDGTLTHGSITGFDQDGSKMKIKWEDGSKEESLSQPDGTLVDPNWAADNGEVIRNLTELRRMLAMYRKREMEILASFTAARPSFRTLAMEAWRKRELEIKSEEAAKKAQEKEAARLLLGIEEAAKDPASSPAPQPANQPVS